MIESLSVVPLLDYSIYTGNLNELEGFGKTLINTINQYSFCIAENDLDFKKSLQESDVLLPDGMAIVSAVRFLYGKKIKKIAGADIHQFLLEDLNAKSGSCFYLGSSEVTLQKIKNRINLEFPNVHVNVFSPPYKTEFSEKDNQEMIAAVNAARPDVLFVGMTAPKQEKWSYTNKRALDTTIICSIGAVFDFYAGTVKRPSYFWIKLKLEWFVRLIKEPKRMWKRYLYYGPIFIKLILVEKMKNSKMTFSDL